MPIRFQRGSSCAKWASETITAVKTRQENRRLRVGRFVPDLERSFIDDLREFRTARPLDTVWVLVPGLDLRRRLRRRLADDSVPIFNVRFVLFPDLAREILAHGPAGGPEPVFLNPSSARVLLAGLVERLRGTDDYFGPVSRRGGFVEALFTTLDDLDHAGIEPGTIRAAGRRQSGASGRKLASLARIHETWRRTLAEKGFRTAAGLPRAAALAAASFPGETLQVYGFYDLNGVQRDLLEALLPGRDVTFYLPEVAAEDSAFSNRVRGWLGRNGFLRPGSGPAPGGPAPAATSGTSPSGDPSPIRMFSAAGERREVEEVARRILGRLDEGIRPDDMAVVYRGVDPYAELLRATFARAGIPAFHHDPATLQSVRPARALRLFVRAALSGASRREIIDFFDVVLPVDGTIAGDGVTLAAAWDELTARAGITRGRGDWTDRLDRLARSETSDSAGAPGAAAGDDAEGGRSPAWRSRAREALAAAVRDLFSDVDVFLAAASWRDLTARALDAIERRTEPSPGRDQLFQIAEGLADLDRTGEPASAARFQAALDDLLARTPLAREPLERAAVHVGDVLSVRGLSFRHLFVVGMAEKSFPRAPSQDPILLDRERELLNAAGAELPLRSAAADEETILFALLRESAPGLTLSYSRIEPVEARPRLPSPFLLRVQAEASGEAADYTTLEQAIERVPLDLMARAAHVGRLRPEEIVPVDPASFLDARSSLDRAEFDCLVVAAASGAGRFDRLAGLCLESAVLRRAIPGDAARWRNDRFTVYDGFIESPAAREALARIVPAGKMWSASRLETYAQCPFKYWVRNYLGIDPRDNPEDQEGADNRERGTLIHEILRLFLGAHRNTVLAPAGRSELRAALLRVADERIALFEREKVTGYPLRWSVDAAALKDDLLVWLDFELDRAGASPARGFEVGFGMTPRDGEVLDPDSSPAPARLMLRDGREVAFHGKIDRIDFDPERRHARVVDYKSGKKPKTERKGMDGGRNLQLPMYLHALSGILPDVLSGEAEYLYLRNETCPVSYGRSGFPEIRQDLADVVAPLIAGIEAGRFFAAPGHCDWQGECELKSICGVRIEDRFDRKRNDPRVSDHPSVRLEGE